jgi:hypothetical protein
LGKGESVLTVWTVDFETPVCKLYLLFLSAMLPKKKKKREESAAATGVSKSTAYTVSVCKDP